LAFIAYISPEYDPAYTTPLATLTAPVSIAPLLGSPVCQTIFPCGVPSRLQFSDQRCEVHRLEFRTASYRRAGPQPRKQPAHQPEAVLNLEHYLDVLERKPGAMAGSTPLEQSRAAGRWPECLDAIWRKLETRHGRSGGTREMISLVRAGLSDGWQRLIGAVEEALRLGITDAAAVVHILRMPDGEERRRHALKLAEELKAFERPMPVMDEYDQLLSDGGAIK
jgi:hypothetical protein